MLTRNTNLPLTIKTKKFNFNRHFCKQKITNYHQNLHIHQINEYISGSCCSDLIKFMSLNIELRLKESER